MLYMDIFFASLPSHIVKQNLFVDPQSLIYIMDSTSVFNFYLVDADILVPIMRFEFSHSLSFL